MTSTRLESARHAIIAPDWALRGYSDRPLVLVNGRDGRSRTLSAPAAYVARACDGATDISPPLFLPRHLVLLDQLIEEGLAVECAAGAALDPWQRLLVAPNRHLGFVSWAVTGRCNLSCRHCYMESPAGRYGEVSTEGALRIVDQLARAAAQRVHLTGGEALVRDDFWTIVEALAERRIAIHQLSTNGVLVDDEVLARFRALGLDPIIHFSFDGLGTHDGMRGSRGVEDRVLEAMRKTAEAGFRTGVTSSLDRETYAGILGSADVLAELGVTTWHVGAPHPIGCWRDSDTCVTLAEQAELSEALIRRWLALGRPYVLLLCGMWGGSSEGYDPPQEPLHRCHPEDMHCGALLDGTAYIMPDARLIPCPRFIDTPIQARMPSLLDVELSEAWEDPGLRGLVAVTKAQVLEHNPDCAACAEFAECGAGCWALAYTATGDLLGADPATCELFKSPYRRRLAAVAAGE